MHNDFRYVFNMLNRIVDYINGLHIAFEHLEN